MVCAGWQSFLCVHAEDNFGKTGRSRQIPIPKAFSISLCQFCSLTNKKTDDMGKSPTNNVSRQSLADTMNLQCTSAESLQVLCETEQENETGSGFFNISGFYTRGKKENSVSNMIPFVQIKLLIMDKNPAMFLRLKERLRGRQSRFSRHHQRNEIHNFLNELKIVEARREITNHVLTSRKEGPIKQLQSSFATRRKSIRVTEWSSDDSTVETCGSDSRGSGFYSPSSISPKSRNDDVFKIFAKTSQTKHSAPSTPPVVVLPLNRYSKVYVED